MERHDAACSLHILGMRWHGTLGVGDKGLNSVDVFNA